MRSAKILVIRLGGVATEIVKNLVLGGINTIEIFDSLVVKEEDFATQFFLPNDDSIVGQPKLPLVLPKIQELNTRVHLLINTESLFTATAEYYKKFDLVVATEVSKDELLHINGVTRSLGLPLYVAGLHGMFGYILTDLIEHESTKELEKGNQPREIKAINGVKHVMRVEHVEKSGNDNVTVLDKFVPLSEIFSLVKLREQLNKRQLRRLSAALPLTLAMFDVERPSPEDDVPVGDLDVLSRGVCEKLQLPESIISAEYLDIFSKQAFTEFAPVAAILGGILAQDIIQFFGKKDSPINNCLVFDATRSELPIYYL